MTLEEAVDLIRFIVADKMPGKKLRVEELNSILKVVDYDLFQEIYGLPGMQKGWEMDEQTGMAILPFKTSATVALTSGSGTLPTDFFHWGRCSYTSGSDEIPIDLVTTAEAEQRRFNSVTEPTARHPIAEIKNSTTIQVYPTTITSITLSYLKRPTPASYVIKNENGIDVYDSTNSVQFAWSADKHISLIRLILKYLGLSVNDSFIVQYSEQKQAQTN